MRMTCYWAVTVKNGTRANNDAFFAFSSLVVKIKRDHVAKRCLFYVFVIMSYHSPAPSPTQCEIQLMHTSM